MWSVTRREKSVTRASSEHHNRAIAAAIELVAVRVPVDPATLWLVECRAYRRRGS
jgi:hypothetical protein